MRSPICRRLAAGDDAPVFGVDLWAERRSACAAGSACFPSGRVERKLMAVIRRQFLRLADRGRALTTCGQLVQKAFPDVRGELLLDEGRMTPEVAGLLLRSRYREVGQCPSAARG